MNKKLLTAAVGAAIAVTAMSANAGVKVFGSAQFEINSATLKVKQDNSVTGTTIADDSIYNSSLRDRQRGRWGIKASEDLGGGIKGLAHIEFDTSGEGTNAGGGTCGGLGCAPGQRQIWAGVKGKFGLVSGGSHHGIYKTFGGVKWDPLTATFLEARNTVAMSGGAFGHNNFLDRSVRYVSPKFGGVTLGLMRVVDYTDIKHNETGTTPDQDTNGIVQNGSWQAGLKGKWGMTEAIAVYAVQTQNKQLPNGGATQADGDSTRMKLGARFTIAKAHKIAVQYEIINDRRGRTMDTRGIDPNGNLPSFTRSGGANSAQGSDRIETHGYLNWVGKFGSIMPQVGLGIYAASDESVGSIYDNDTAGTFLQAAVSWRPSKTFRVFGGLRTQTVKNQESLRVSGTDTIETNLTEQTFSVGIRKDF